MIDSCSLYQNSSPTSIITRCQIPETENQLPCYIFIEKLPSEGLKFTCATSVNSQRTIIQKQVPPKMAHDETTIIHNVYIH